ncbi:MAG: thioredoxin family protein [Magnetococcales bacterium]|nr:thioredoxin family protein [Magnetococcales bacterium]
MAVKSTPSESLRSILRNTPHHKLVFVIFTGKSCFVCEKLRQHLPWFANAHREKIHVMAIDTQKHPDLSTEYGVFAIPTIVVFSKGERILTEMGVDSKDQLKSMLKTALRASTP